MSSPTSVQASDNPDLRVLDGGLATHLETQGYQIQDKLWSAVLLRTHPEAIRGAHQDYLEAGVDVITSASYQATLPGFMASGVSRNESIQLIERSVELATSARDEFWEKQPNDTPRRRPEVAASIGPYGAFLSDGSEYTGAYAIGCDELKAFHQERWHILAESGPDLMLCETIPTLQEALVLAQLATETPQLPTWISMSCQSAQKACDGSSFVDCAHALESYPAVTAIGANCFPPSWAADLIGAFHNQSSKSILVYPNSGEAYDIASQSWTGVAEASDFARLAVDWQMSGASIIGGCCRTTPNHLRQLSHRLRP